MKPFRKKSVLRNLLLLLFMLNGAACFSLGIFEKLRGTETENGGVAAGPADTVEAVENGSNIDGAETESGLADVANEETEETEKMAVLLQGPIVKKGLPFFPTNAIPSFYGKYEFREVEIAVYYTERKIVRKDEWKPVECGGMGGLLVPSVSGGEHTEIALFPSVDNDRYTLFFIYPETFSDFCTFLVPFITRLEYFFGITRDVSSPPFPAIVPIE